MENKKLEKGYLMNIIFMVVLSMAMLFFMCNSSICASLGLADYTILGKYITKGTASILFVAFGIVNLLYAKKAGAFKNPKFMIFMVIGLFFAMLGDIFLIEFFIVGALLFAVGHVFYFVAFCFISKFKVRDIICMSAIFVPALIFILLYPNFVFDGMLPVVIVYALIISGMLGKSVSNIFEQDNRLLNVIIALGALMFFLSDLMLLFNVFGSAPYLLDVICIALYYPAEFVLAFSIFMVGFKFKKSETNN